MEGAGYTTLTRQSGLMRSLQVIAHNIANISTVGFRREGVIFSEYVQNNAEGPSLSMAYANARLIDLTQASLNQTGGSFDFAIEGEGFFLLETGQGQRLTRAGAFLLSAEGEVVTSEGHRLLDVGGAPITLPMGAAAMTLGADGTLSVREQVVAQVGLWRPVDSNALQRKTGVMFEVAEFEPQENIQIVQGALEESNVNAVSEIARLIVVQRAYEAGQSFLQREDERVRTLIQTMGRPGGG